MKRNRRTRRSDNMRVIRLWTRPQADKALPYLRSITSSLRDHWLKAQSNRLEAARLGKIARPSRTELIALEEAKKAQDASEEAFNEALEELMKLDVFLLDPVQGHALVPFQVENELAWYVFDMFDADGLTSWRFHKDPIETRRPISDVPVADAVAV